jgi:hypothetical protein
MVLESEISGAEIRKRARLVFGSVQCDKALVRCPEAERHWSGVEGAGTLLRWVQGQARTWSVVQGAEKPCQSAETESGPHANFLVCISAPFGPFRARSTIIIHDKLTD